MNSIIELSMLTNFVEWLVVVSLKTIPLILLVLILQRLFRHFFSAAAHHLLWFTVLASLVVPIGWNINIKPSDEQVFAEAPQAQFDDGDFVQQTTVNNASISTPGVSMTSETTWLTVAKNNIRVLIAITWLIGVMILLAVTLIKARAYYRIKRQALIAPLDVAELFEACKQKMHFSKRVHLYCSSEIATPIAMGVLQPTIIIPIDIEKALTPEQLQYVLLHELGHIKRHDIAFNWVVSVINIFHWFNPFVWFACRRMRTDMEAACDAVVLSHLPKKQHRNYGETLIELSDFLPYSARSLSAVGILENHHELKERLKMIKQVTTMNVKRIVLFGVILVGTAVTAFAQPIATPNNPAITAQQKVDIQSMTLQDLAVVAEKTFKTKVLLGQEHSSTIVRINTDINNLDYPTLLTQLKVNEFTAYKSEGVIRFIPTKEARFSPTPVVEKNKTYFSDEYVTEYIKLEKACTDNLMPALRPMVPQTSQLGSSHNPEMFIITDTYLNIQRIKSLIMLVENEMEKPADCYPKKQK